MQPLDLFDPIAPPRVDSSKGPPRILVPIFSGIWSQFSWVKNIFRILVLNFMGEKYFEDFGPEIFMGDKYFQEVGPKFSWVKHIFRNLVLLFHG